MRVSFLRNRCNISKQCKYLSTFAELSSSKPNRIQLSKIVATIGPASEQLPALTQVVQAGMKIMRINFSHATFDEANLRSTNILKVSSPDGQREKNLYSVMLDTQGPEIRTGSFPQGIKEIELKQSDSLILSINNDVRSNQTSDKIWISYTKLFETVRIGTSILLDDGAIEVKVRHIDALKGEVTCTIVNSGSLGNKKGVNIPGKSILLPAMCEKDEIDIRWGIENDIDYIAASFVRKASDVTEIRNYTKKLLIEKYGPTALEVKQLPRIISKIESTEALANFDSILEESDAIMVARGDLGVEIPLECLAGVQKEIVRRCNIAGKPVVVATQMLESMQKKPRPTRAECTDVYNAVLDGADCVMLSGESAKGDYPVQSIAMMRRIVDQAEAWISAHPSDTSVVQVKPDTLDPHLGVAYGVVEASKNLHSSCIIVITRTGVTAGNVARFRPNVPIVTLVPTAKVGRLLQVTRGIHPIVMTTDLTRTSTLPSLDRFDTAVELAKAQGFCKSGDNVIVVAGDPQSNSTSTAMTMRVVNLL